MPKKILIAGALFLLLIAGLVASQFILGRHAVASTGLHHHSLEEAYREAAAESKYVLADVSAIWCPNCRALNKEVYAEDRIRQRLNNDFVYTRIEFGSVEGKRFREHFDIQAPPALLLLDAKGNLMHTLPISYEPIEFLENLDVASAP
ncbi:Thioredoxin family protein [Sulfidibacter corallicola]|uniref:Thioredoxin family protein n=1 Tax=Sulfidibacter corallicola TaxID=2818388 RepID=A0A8A4TP27_SULCO|nr:thioredoxin family protein [Sulfidibacter corallicola]QTD48345.1 thioredoxin family protein [Sulfidibacter corallicola]